VKTQNSAVDGLQSADNALLIDRLGNEFEDAWATGVPVRIEEYLARVAPELRPALLNELLGIEAFHLRRRGDALPIAEYRQRFPELPESVLNSIAGVADAPSVADARDIATVLDVAEPSHLSHAAEPPTRVGDFELIEEIAQGGMGVVFRARDVVLDREVAVKILRDRFPADSDIARRFLEEARITGQLQHPGIPPIHQVGTLPDGRPFLAMKLIKGRTLANLLAEDSKRPSWDFQASVATMPLGELLQDATADRGRFIMVFEQICQAVAYAHARQVIHRDLKPQNIMVGAFGEVQVMDWGLAKVLGEGEERPNQAGEATGTVTAIRTGRDPDSETQAGSLLGTPAYMSPEQAGGEIDKLGPPTDVFGLGAILCEILTGRPPYVGEDAESIRLQAVRGRLEESFTLLDACDNMLVPLAKRCLAVEPADRPADAAAVAAEVAGMRTAAQERARQAEMESAAAAARETEQRKRRRGWQAVTAVGLVILLAVTTASLIAAHVFRRQRDRIDTALTAETKAHEAEKQARERAMATLRVMSDELVENQLAQRPDLTDENKEFLRTIIEHFEALAAITGDDVESRAIRAEGYFRVGIMRARLGELKEAEATQAKALALFRELAREFPSRSLFQQQVAWSLGNLSVTQTHRGQFGDAENSLVEALAIRRRLAADAPPGRREPAEPGCQPQQSQ